MGIIFSGFGNRGKGIIGGMFLGLILLPLGIFMQKFAVEQMQYHKEFAKAIRVASPSDSKITKNGTLVWTEGQYKLIGGAPFTPTTLDGDTFPGQYISYDIKKYNIVKKLRQEKSRGGQVVKEYYEFLWEVSDSYIQQSHSANIAINGFNVDFDKFTKKYITMQKKYFKYSSGQNSNAVRRPSNKLNVKNLGLFEGYPSGQATESDFLQGIYAYAVSGYLYDSNKEKMLICGITSPHSTDMGALVYKKQKMLVVSYNGYDDTLQSLKSDAHAERLFKFVGGAIFFMIGFTLLLGPIIKLLNFIPFLGNLAIGVIYFICAVISLILSVLFYIFFALWWLIILLGIGIPLLLFIIKPIFNKKNA